MLNKIRKTLALGVAVCLTVTALAGCGQSNPTPSPSPSTAAEGGQNAQQPSTASNYPTKDISVIVPWNPGGGTDLTVRALTDEMANVLGKRMPVTNMPGASGSVGMQDVYDSSRDGYKILGHGMMAFTNSQVMGLTENSYKDWVVWDAAFSPNVVTVRKDSPYKTIDELIEAMKANPGKITVGSAGIGTGGHIGATVFAEGVGVTFEHIPYEGGNPAITATLSGEVDMNVQLSMEMIDLLRSGDLVGLACLSDNDLVIDGVDGEIVIPSIKNVAPEMSKLLPVGESFGILVPKETPEDVISKIDEAYKVAVESDSFKALAESKGMVIFGYGIEQTKEYLDKLASIVCWTLFDTGSAKISPETVGIPRP